MLEGTIALSKLNAEEYAQGNKSDQKQGNYDAKNEWKSIWFFFKTQNFLLALFLPWELCHIEILSDVLGGAFIN